MIHLLNKNMYITHRHGQQCDDNRRERGVWVGGGWQSEGKRGQQETAWGNEHTVQCADDVLWSCALDTCIASQKRFYLFLFLGEGEGGKKRSTEMLM